MATNEGVPKTGEAVVINYYPDFCWTPIGANMVILPYHIVAFFEDSVNEVQNVLYNGNPAVNAASAITHVYGNEAGTGGGIFSGVCGGGCRPVGWSSTVYVQGKPAVYHSSDYLMNCDGLTGTPNCRGKAVYVRSDVPLPMGPDFFGPRLDPAAVLSLARSQGLDPKLMHDLLSLALLRLFWPAGKFREIDDA